MGPIEIFGLCAGAITVAGYLPQTIKTIRTRKTKDLALGTFLILALGALAWLIYGAFIGSMAIVITNSIVLVCSAIITIIKLADSRKRRKG